MGQLKVELSSQKELQQLAAAISGAHSNIEKMGVKLAQMLSEAIKQKDQLGQAVYDAESNSNVAKGSITEYLAKAKELGLDGSNSVEVKKLQALFEQTKEYTNYFKGIGTIPNI